MENSRRRFLKRCVSAAGTLAIRPLVPLGVTTLGVGVLSCENAVGPVKVDVLLEEIVDKAAQTVRTLFEKLRALAANPEINLTMGWTSDKGSRVTTVSIIKKGLVDHPYLHISDTIAGEANVILARRGIGLELKFTDDAGNVLVRNGRELRASIGLLRPATPGKVLRSVDLIGDGITWAAILFALWIGVSVVGAVLAAIGYILYIGILIALLVAAVGFVQEVFPQLGLNLGSLQEFVERAVEITAELFRQIIERARHEFDI